MLLFLHLQVYSIVLFLLGRDKSTIYYREERRGLNAEKKRRTAFIHVYSSSSKRCTDSIDSLLLSYHPSLSAITFSKFSR